MLKKNLLQLVLFLAPKWAILPGLKERKPMCDLSKPLHIFYLIRVAKNADQI